MIRVKRSGPKGKQPVRKFAVHFAAGLANPLRLYGSNWKLAHLSASLWQEKELNFGTLNTSAVGSAQQEQQQK
jgi:hypothetical protein